MYKALGVFFCCLILAGCARPPLSVIRNQVPILAQGEGRVYFYKADGKSGVGQILFEGKRIGGLGGHHVFFIDLPAGTHKFIATASLIMKYHTHELILDVVAGETYYLEYIGGKGGGFAMSIPALAMATVNSLNYSRSSTLHDRRIWQPE